LFYSCTYDNSEDDGDGAICDTLNPQLKQGYRYFMVKDTDCYKIIDDDRLYCDYGGNEIPEIFQSGKYENVSFIDKMRERNCENVYPCPEPQYLEKELTDYLPQLLLGGLEVRDFNIEDEVPMKLKFEKLSRMLQKYLVNGATPFELFNQFEIWPFIEFVNPELNITSESPLNMIIDPVAGFLDETMIDFFGETLKFLEINPENLKTLLSKYINQENITNAEFYKVFNIDITQATKLIKFIYDFASSKKSFMDNLITIGFEKSKVEKFVDQILQFLNKSRISIADFYDIYTDNKQLLEKARDMIKNQIWGTYSGIENVYNIYIQKDLNEALKVFSTSLQDYGNNQTVNVTTYTELVDSLIECFNLTKLLEFATEFDYKKDPLPVSIFKGESILKNAVFLFNSTELQEFFDAIIARKSIKEIINLYKSINTSNANRFADSIENDAISYYDQTVKSFLLKIANNTAFDEEWFPETVLNIIKMIPQIASFYNENASISQLPLTYDELGTLLELPINETINYFTNADFDDFLRVVNTYYKIINNELKKISFLNPIINEIKPIKYLINELGKHLSYFYQATKENSTMLTYEALQQFLNHNRDRVDFENIKQIFKQDETFKQLIDALDFKNSIINLKQTIINLGNLTEKSEFGFGDFAKCFSVPTGSSYTFNDIVPIYNFYKVLSENEEAVEDGSISIDKFNLFKPIGLDILNKFDDLQYKSIKGLLHDITNGYINSNRIFEELALYSESMLNDECLDISGRQLGNASQGLTGGQITGIVIGSLAGAAIIVLLVLFFVVWRKSDDEENIEQKEQNNEDNIGTTV